RRLLIDDGRIGRRDRGQTRLIEVALFEVREEERAVSHDGSSQARPVLLLVHWELLTRQSVGGVERIVAKVVVHVSLQRVGAALGHHVDVATQGATQFRLAARGDDLKLVYGINTVRDAAQSSRIVVGRKTIDDEVVREVALAADRQTPLAGDGRRLRKELRAGDVGW